ncbi:siderophore-interacting protein [Aeromicrobium senzhongii]|uniref:Siderophore-interacting protein n=1 Tax=Aeromicrobium senzhongii TaxID=2663859 RepID=A0A8I0EVD1_9ACTN|nr:MULTISPECIES: siderophore-interacting protein [Aeromicrobium]MBC9226920.1 siderophore-interacting protein [Aeromicrobium senzhongii]QNL94390.1 siderophore-interacting protein [Aeromicrobium senzhongii]
MKTYAATVLGRRQLTPHLVSITLGGLEGWQSTGIPDEYVRLLLPPHPGAKIALPTINEDWSYTYPEGAEPLVPRVYTISDHRVVDGDVRVDVDIALHEQGAGSDWARTCQPGDRVGVLEPHGLYRPAADARHQLLVCDITGVPALARILRELDPGVVAEVHVVVSDAADEVPLPSAADVHAHWEVVEDEHLIPNALEAAVTGRDLPADWSGRYVWLAGEARASRAVRKHLRRGLGWPQAAFYTCGYWQIEAEKWNARYEEVAEMIRVKALAAYERAGQDEGAYLDELDDIYESVGL